MGVPDCCRGHPLPRSRCVPPGHQTRKPAVPRRCRPLVVVLAADGMAPGDPTDGSTKKSSLKLVDFGLSADLTVRGWWSSCGCAVCEDGLAGGLMTRCCGTERCACVLLHASQLLHSGIQHPKYSQWEWARGLRRRTPRLVTCGVAVWCCTCCCAVSAPLPAAAVC